MSVGLTRSEFPLNRPFYEQLIKSRPTFAHLSSTIVVPDRGYGFAAEAGHVFRFTMVEDAQTLDTCFLSAEDPTTEYFLPGVQLAIEGFVITRLTRLWSTPPKSRPLATCIADTVRPRPNAFYMRDHFCHTAYCNSHVRRLFARSERNACYDNLREGIAMLGLSQRYIPDNVNLFMKGAIDPITGAVLVARSDARRDDYIEFYAEVPLFCVFSLCPAGGGSDDALLEGYVDPPTHPIRLDLYSSGIDPLAWPY
jgi:uncharacterized protein YcgI (DUF1989 family)